MIIKYPKKYPNTNCKYPNFANKIAPGTEINVTPDKESPSIPNATTYQGDSLSPSK